MHGIAYVCCLNLPPPICCGFGDDNGIRCSLELDRETLFALPSKL